MAVGLSGNFFLRDLTVPANVACPPKHMSAFEPSSLIQQVDPDTDMTVTHI